MRWRWNNKRTITTLRALLKGAFHSWEKAHESGFVVVFVLIDLVDTLGGNWDLGLDAGTCAYQVALYSLNWIRHLYQGII